MVIGSVTFLSQFLDVISFFPRAATLWNSLLVESFPLSYDLNCLKCKFCRHLGLI